MSDHNKMYVIRWRERGTIGSQWQMCESISAVKIEEERIVEMCHPQGLAAFQVYEIRPIDISEGR